MADTMREVASRMPIDAVHINLSENLTLADRLVRRALSIKLAPSAGSIANVDFRRWRQELNVGLLAAKRLADAERSRPFDLLHFHTQNAAYASVKRMSRTPAIVSIDATSRLASLEASSPVARWTYSANIAHDAAVFRAARAIVATSAWAARDLVDRHPDGARKAHVLPYPVRDVFGADIASARAARRNDAAPVRVLFMGGDFPRKGGDALLAAWRDASFGAAASLDLVTDWPLPAVDLPAGVTLIRGVAPYSQQWIDLWRAADVFAMPSAHEAFGIVYEEAAAAAVPAVGTAINAVPEIIADGETGLLVPPGDRAALVGALRTLVGSADLRRRFGAAARARIERTALPDAYADQLGAIVMPLLVSHAA